MGIVFTVGHGTRSVEELVELLGEGPADTLVDVRRFPGSSRSPHLSRAALADVLPPLGVTYLFRGDTLGGRRTGRDDSPHLAWENASFRAYADHMETDAFQRALGELEAEARAGRRMALMCAETLWWRCHRRLIADALVARGLAVVHLLGPGARSPHALHSAARPDGAGGLIYDVGAQRALPLAGPSRAGAAPAAAPGARGGGGPRRAR
ncbi:hypothetical protein SOCE26_100670 [Sorangium cellulosum]|uniref:DNA repair protein n=1 Tax=Sorangium cellulosum TaxID=56 RepID=A0A2L0FAR0_SORCE|nr:DUF488 domain-containing protein [Sorangium cellulosum]AUX48529.1 hypothetical protein SOCE26_100670 [Sorangium cellulosum]